MEGLYREFGEILRAHRKAAGLTQSEVAERVQLQRTSITNIEKGRQHVPLHQLFRLASAVGAEPADLLPHASAAEELISAEAMRELDGSGDVEMVARVLNSAATTGTQSVEPR
jgi:transcriptional regulator with XRE-family HTH domain